MSRARIASCALAGVVGLGAVTSCSYPEFTYGAGGGGGAGGDGSTSSGPVAQVSCGDPPLQCTAGQVCCFHKTTPMLDHCGEATMCGPEYDEFYCNTKDDCGAGICCAKDNDPAAKNGIDVISCQTTCDATSEYVMCADAAECPTQMCLSITMNPPYPGYMFCVK